MRFAACPRRRQVALLGPLVLGLAACATPTTEVKTTAEDAVYTASGRYPAENAGILIAQNAALSQGRSLCEDQGKRFRPLASVAGDDPSTGEAIYAVRFRCIIPRGALAPILAPLPTDDAPKTGGRT